jgi:hypothetical protein
MSRFDRPVATRRAALQLRALTAVGQVGHDGSTVVAAVAGYDAVGEPWRTLKWRAVGADHADIGRVFRRRAGHIERIEQLAAYKLAR